MWILLTIIHAFTMALVNYIDEFLTHNSSVFHSENIHKKVGWVLLITMLFGSLSVLALSFFIEDFSISQTGLLLSLFSAFPMTLMFASYFYLFQKFPAHQVVPLFGLSSIWLLILELFVGASIPVIPLIWVFFLLYGAYILDIGSFAWKIPTKLFEIMIPVSFLWSLSLFLIVLLPKTDSVLQFFFYQYVMIFIIWVILFCIVKSYRQGLLDRIQKQGKIFLGGSILNESLAQISFFAWMLAVSLAPLATYVTAISSVQYLFLFILFLSFPLHQRNQITYIQCIAMMLMILGILLIDIFK